MKAECGGPGPRNGLCHSCACGRVAGVVPLLGSAGRLGFVAPPPRRSRGGSVSGGVRFGRRGPEECVLLGEIYNMSYRS